MLVHVTEEDIRLGHYNISNCPVELALTRCMRAEKADVGNQVITLRMGFGRHFYQTPSIVRRFVEDFDRGDQVRPFTFDLPQPASIF